MNSKIRKKELINLEEKKQVSGNARYQIKLPKKTYWLRIKRLAQTKFYVIMHGNDQVAVFSILEKDKAIQELNRLIDLDK